MNSHLFRRLMSAGLMGLVFFAPDDGTGGGGTGGNGAAASDGQGSQTGGSDQGQAGTRSGEGAAAQGTPPTFTAEQTEAINAEVARQLGSAVAPKVTAAKTQWERDLQALADAENQTAEQQANARAEAAEQAARERIASSNARLVAADAKVAALGAGANPARVDALLKLTDLTGIDVSDDGTVDTKEVRARIDKTIADFPEFKAGATPGTSGSEHHAQTITAEQFATMGYSERVKLRADNPELYAKLAG